MITSISRIKTGIFSLLTAEIKYKSMNLKKDHSQQRTEESLNTLLEVIKKLRSPEGCLWDRQQKTEDIARYLLDETYEVLDAIESDSPAALREEMGDLLFQICFIASISEEAGDFSLSDVIEEVTEKMIRRHPHVFGNTKVRNIEEIRTNWEDIKKNVENKKQSDISVLAGIPRSMPALLAAQKMTENASKVGFDWENCEEVLVKIDEELLEFKTALKSDNSKKIKEEMGDILLSLVNVCRFIDVNAEDAMKAAMKKFGDRFKYIEDKLSVRGKTPMEVSLAEMDDLWNESKWIEKD
jgi:tetrapyrrole methylase family protein / MazG family protein